MASPFTKEYPIGAKVPWYLFVFKNRWSRLVIYMLTGLFTSLFFDGWQDISDMMFKEGVYSWRCPQPWDGEICDEQYQSVQRLFTVCIISCGSNSLTGGFLVDLIGPMMTALVAELSFMLGLLLWALSSQSLQMYIPAFFFLAAGVNPLSFAMLEIRQMFPGREALIVSIVMAPLTVAPVIPLVLNRIHANHPNVTMSALVAGYLLVVALPTTIMVVLSLPVWRFPSAVAKIGDGVSTADLDESRLDLQSRAGAENDGGKPISQKSFSSSEVGIRSAAEQSRNEDDSNRTESGNSVAATKDQDAQDYTPATTAAIEESVAAATLEIAESPSALMSVDGGLLVYGTTEIGDGASQIAALTSAAKADEDDEYGAADEHGGRRMKAHAVDWVLLSYELRTPEFWLYSAFNVISALQIGYYPTTVRAWGTNEQGEALSRFYGIVTPTQGVYSIAFGFMVAATTSIGVALTFCFFLTMLFAFSLVPSFGLQYASCMLSNFVQSFIFTLRFTFTGEKFANKNFGLLVGILGTFPAFSYPITFGVQMPSVFTTLYLILLCITSISFGCVIALLVRQCKKYDPREETLASAAAAKARKAAAVPHATAGVAADPAAAA